MINKYGANISKEGGCFRLECDDESKEISATKVEQIIISNSSRISVDAIELAFNNDIDIVFIDKHGKYMGRLWNNCFGKAAKIRRNQLKLSENKLGLEIMEDILITKLKNQCMHLKKLSRNRKDERQNMIEENISKIQEEAGKIKKTIHLANSIQNFRYTIQGYEGNAGKVYFKTLSDLIPAKYKFEGRSKHPAKDEFNSMLNYGYGVLYSEIEKSCIEAGLDPYIGIMHTDYYNKKVLTFDLIEKYRVYVEGMIFKLFTKNQIKNEYFIRQNNSCLLNDKGKKLFYATYDQMINKSFRYNGRLLKLPQIIEMDCNELAKKIASLDEVCL